MGGASDEEPSLAVADDEKALLLAEERGVSCGEGAVLSEGAGPVEEVNRCSGGSAVLVEIQASSSTISSSRELKSSVTSSPTPSIRAIAHGNAPSHRGTFIAE